MERCLFECGDGGSINQPTVNWITLDKSPALWCAFSNAWKKKKTIEKNTFGSG